MDATRVVECRESRYRIGVGIVWCLVGMRLMGWVELILIKSTKSSRKQGGSGVEATAGG